MHTDENDLNQSTAEFLSELKSKNIKLWVEDGLLRFRAPKGVLNEEIKSRLKDRKENIIDYFERKNAEKIFSSPIEPVEEQEYYPLSAAQRRMFVLNQMDRDSTAYNLTQVYKIEGAFDKERLSAVIGQLIDRHESLRTSYFLKDGKPVQKIHRKIDFNLEYKENDADQEQIDKEIYNFIRPYDLSKPPLFRMKLIKMTGTDTYYLLYDMHHIISDGISVAIMVDEINKLYSNITLPDLKIQYKDYAAWQENKLLSGYRLMSQKKYWHEQFQNELPMLNLPGNFQRPSEFNYKGDSINHQIDKPLTDKLHSLARENRVTMFIVLLAAYNVLLSKYTGQTDIVVGTPTGGRRHADADNIMGIFINTLPLRHFPEPDKKFTDFIKEVGKNVLEAFDNQDYPFEQLVEDLNVKRDLSRNPVFDTAFVLENMNVQDVRIDGIKVSEYKFAKKLAQYDITVYATENNGGINVEIEYYTGLFKKETVEQFYKHFVRILEEITKNPNAKLHEINMLTAEEQNRLLYEFNDTAVEYPREKTIPELFEEQAEMTPDSTALIFKNCQLTYAELNRRANSLARVLREKGVKPDSIVGIMAERSLKLFIAILAVLKAGGAYLPIDPEYPADRTQYMLENSESKLLITQQSLAEKTEFSNDKIYLDDEDLYNGDGTNLEKASTPDNLAYIIYTSGSTGKPKGVMIEHRSVNNFIKGISDRIDFREGRTILNLTTISFDIFGLETLLPLSKGLRIVVADENQQKDPQELSKIIVDGQIEMLQATPSRIRLLLSSESGFESLSGIKELMVGGEALPKDLFEVLSTLPSTRIFNMYGPTETTIWSTVKELTSNREITIGKPIANTQVYILDKNNNLQPEGIAGELCIAGDGLARGYLNRPEQTNEKFVENPFNKGTKMYKTGDLAAWLPNGEINCLGRVDFQVKIRGFRIELEEIENRLIEHEKIKQAVVLAKEDNNGIKYLCAYIVSKSDVTVPELRKYLLEKLPDYMVPSYFVQLDELPLTPNGKVNRKALPESGITVDTGIEFTAPSNFLEKSLAQIWKKVLNKDKISIKDDFFEIGGNSILVIHLVSEMKKIGIEIKVSEIFKYSTIEKIESYVESTNQNISLKELPVTELDAEKADFKIINSVGENDGSHTWKQLDCFYRPMSILFDSFESGYSELFLFYVSYYNCFMADGWYSEIFEEYKMPHRLFFEFNDGFLKERLGLEVSRNDIFSEDDLHDKIKKEIDKGSPVLVPVDLFCLSYSARYMEEHHRHYIIIKGYSKTKKLYYILDNMHVENGASTIYKNFMLKETELFEMLCQYFKIFSTDSKTPCFYSVSKCKQRKTEKITPAAVLKEHYEHLKKLSSNEAQVRYLFCEVIKQIKATDDSDHCDVAVQLNNFKEVYYNILFKLLSDTGVKENDIVELEKKRNSVSQLWKNIEIKILDIVFQKNGDLSDLDQLTKEAVSKEEELRDLITVKIEKSNLNKCLEQESSENRINALTEMNKCNALIISENDKIKMKLSSSKIYNTWLTEDNCPQLLLMLNNNNDFSIETRITVLELQGEKSNMIYHSGIILKFVNGIKLLFGMIKESSVKEGVVKVLCPENGEKDILFERTFSGSINSVWLKVEKQQQLFNYYFKINQEDEWESVLSIKSSNEAKCVGLNARTWEATNHEVEFDSIKYSVSDQ